MGQAQEVVVGRLVSSRKTTATTAANMLSRYCTSGRRIPAARRAPAAHRTNPCQINLLIWPTSLPLSLPYSYSNQCAPLRRLSSGAEKEVTTTPRSYNYHPL